MRHLICSVQYDRGQPDGELPVRPHDGRPRAQRLRDEGQRRPLLHLRWLQVQLRQHRGVRPGRAPQVRRRLLRAVGRLGHSPLNRGRRELEVASRSAE